MTDRETTYTGDDGPGEPGSRARSYQPGSRLRQALDLARRSAAATPAGPASMPAAGNTAPQPATAPTAEPAEPAQTNESTGDAVFTTLVPPADGATARNRGPGRGLDALLPADTQHDETAPETWETAAQGWIRTDDDGLEWRPIVTTVDRLDHWKVGTYIGIASGRANTGTANPDSVRLSWGRREAVEHMTADAVSRGAHGIIGVSFSLTAGPTGLVVTATGTAVTLSHRR